MQIFKLSITLLCLITLQFNCFNCNSVNKYEPNWDSLDSRPLPKWFDDAKIGLMLHWGVYSVPAIRSEWIWYDRRMRSSRYSRLNQYLDKTFRVNVSYAEFAPSFTAALFNPNSWAKLFKKAGIKYVVLTGKHLDGYTLWPSKNAPNWNSMEVGPKRDLVGELGTAVREAGLRYGVYCSLFEWFNPLLHTDYGNKFNTSYYIETKVNPELIELVTKYKPDVIWSMDISLPQKYCRSKEFLTWLYNESPVKDNVVVNDRWGTGTMCEHGGVIGCPRRHQPNSKFARKWETAVSLDHTSWGYNRLSHSYRYLTIRQMLKVLTRVVSGGGNILFNIGPTQDGRIPPIVELRLLQLGEWLNFNGIAIYNTEPWDHQRDSVAEEVYYTKQKQSETFFAIVLKPPKNGVLRLGSIRKLSSTSKVSLLTKTGEVPLMWSQGKNALYVKLALDADTKWFHVLKFTKIASYANNIVTSLI